MSQNMKPFTHNCDNDNQNSKTKSKTVDKKRKRKRNNDHDNDNNKKRKFNGDISNLTKLPGIHKDFENWSSLNTFIKSTDSKQERQKLIESSLLAVSNSYKQAFYNFEKEVKIQKRTHHITIKNIDEQIFALSQLKKQMKIKMSEFNKDANTQLNQILSHQKFIDQVLIKSRERMNNNNNDQRLLQQILPVLQEYSQNIKDFEQQILDKKFKSFLPVLAPAEPLKPQQIYNVPKDVYSHNHNKMVLSNYHKQLGIDKHNHNKNVLSNYHQHHGSAYPNIMSEKEVLDTFSTLKGYCDYRDFNGRYYEAQIMEISYNEKYQSMSFGIRFPGWDESKYNVYSFIKHQHYRFAPHKSITKRYSNRQCMKYIKCDKPWGDFLEVKPLHWYNYYKMAEEFEKNDSNKDYHQYQSWHVAKVVCCQLSQVACLLYKYCIESNKWIEPKYCQKKNKWLGDVYWVHLDNDEECVPIRSRLNFKSVNNNKDQQ